MRKVNRECGPRVIVQEKGGPNRHGTQQKHEDHVRGRQLGKDGRGKKVVR